MLSCVVNLGTMANGGMAEWHATHRSAERDWCKIDLSMYLYYDATWRDGRVVEGARLEIV